MIEGVGDCMDVPVVMVMIEELVDEFFYVGYVAGYVMEGLKCGED